MLRPDRRRLAMRVDGVAYRTVWMADDAVRMIDQRRLPAAFTLATLRTWPEVAEAIRDMTVRGAGAIGVAAGYGMALAALRAAPECFDAELDRAAEGLRRTRPTARNLFYAVDRVREAARAAGPVEARRAGAMAAAEAIADEDAAAGARIGEWGQDLLASATNVLTHCNAGWLAFADWGTALAPVYEAHRRGRRLHVYVMETRPRSQGAKLTAWELQQEGVAHTLLPDTAAAAAMRRGLVDLVIVGADRIAANGDVANKIGTYGLALLARAHGIPFYVAAPTTTIDASCPSGDRIPIEERAPEEVLWVEGVDDAGTSARVRIAPEGCPAQNWAFDVTPADHITGLLTERGLIAARPEAIRHMLAAAPAPAR